MNGEHVSVAQREADEAYPIHPKSVMDDDYLQSAFEAVQNAAYVRGRTAEPCGEQIEAVARILFEEPWRKGEAPMSFDEFAAIPDGIVQEKVGRLKGVARMMLEAAREAVAA